MILLKYRAGLKQTCFATAELVNAFPLPLGVPKPVSSKHLLCKLGRTVTSWIHKLSDAYIWFCQRSVLTLANVTMCARVLSPLLLS